MMENRKNGFALVGTIFVMMLMAAAAVGINKKSTTHAKMAANQTYGTRILFGQTAALEQAGWKLKGDPEWRTAGEVYEYNGVSYTRKVENSGIAGYMDAITITVTPPGGIQPVSRSFRLDYSKSTVFFISDTDNNRIRKVDTTGTITTVAGTGTGGYNGDWWFATSKQLNKPNGICLEPDNDLIVADTDNHRVRKVSTLNWIWTIAGTGDGGYSGDGGSATEAKLNKPRGVFQDAAGNLFIADTDNNRIRKVNTADNISTVAGTGDAGYNGDGIAATAAKLNQPEAIWKDAAGNLFIADTNNERVRKVNIAGTISTVAGTGSAGYSGDGGGATAAKLKKPRGVWTDSVGNLFIADSDNERIRKVDTAGIISTVAGTGSAGYSGDGGPAANAQINKPRGLAPDAGGSLYIAETDNSLIRKATPGGFIWTVAGTGSSGYSGDGAAAASAQLNKPRGVCAYHTGQPPELKPVANLYWRTN